MGALLTILARSAFRLTAVLGVVVLLLLAGRWLMSEWASRDAATVDLARLKSTRDAIKVQNAEREQALRGQVPDMTTPIGAVAEQRKRFDQELQALDEQLRSIESENPLTFRIPGSPAFIQLVRVNVGRALLQQAKDYTDQLHELLLSTRNCQRQIPDARARMLEVAASINRKIQDLEELRQAAGLRVLIPFSDASRRKEAIEADLKRLTDDQTRATGRFDDTLRRCADLKPKDRFIVIPGPVAQALQPVDEAIAQLQRKVDTNVFGKYLQPVIDVLPTALVIVLGIFLVPPGIKAFLFFVVAPLVARCAPLRVLPETTGVVEARVSGDGVVPAMPPSAVSQSLVLEPGEALLVHAEYVQSSASNARKATRWLLDWSMPLTSLAAGLYGLMRIEAERAEPIVLSSSSDPLQELVALVLPTGSALVLQPRCLVGLVGRKGEGIRITRHWRLGYLSSWLTLQLRYIVFHGPLTLLIGGCRGVRVEPVSEGRVINQAATLGFSANVAYSNGRCETFGSYLLGQQELLNDRFAGASGAYIYEETPRRGAKGGITGRGLEGVMDSLLKVLGI